MWNSPPGPGCRKRHTKQNKQNQNPQINPKRKTWYREYLKGIFAMSLFGDWKCPKCGREWTGGIWIILNPWNMDEYYEQIEQVCGCTGKKLDDSILAVSIVPKINVSK